LLLFFKKRSACFTFSNSLRRVRVLREGGALACRASGRRGGGDRPAGAHLAGGRGADNGRIPQAPFEWDGSYVHTTRIAVRDVMEGVFDAGGKIPCQIDGGLKRIISAGSLRRMRARFRSSGMRDDGRKQGLLFCEQKRSKKNFSNLPRGRETPGAQQQKFFGSFFQKRTSCFLA
jgi:hypothetical protein